MAARPLPGAASGDIAQDSSRSILGAVFDEWFCFSTVPVRGIAVVLFQSRSRNVRKLCLIGFVGVYRTMAVCCANR